MGAFVRLRSCALVCHCFCKAVVHAEAAADKPAAPLPYCRIASGGWMISGAGSTPVPGESVFGACPS